MNLFKELWYASDLYGEFVETETARCTLQSLAPVALELVLIFVFLKCSQVIPELCV